MTDEERREAQKKRSRAWYLRNRGLAIARAQKRKHEHAESLKAQDHARYLRIREKKIADARQWAAENPERCRESKRRWKRANRDVHQASTRAYRERKRGAKVVEIIPLPEIAGRDDWTCHLCGGDVSRENWSLDHLVPISKGGDHTRENVKLAHMVCNARRGNRDLELAA